MNPDIPTKSIFKSKTAIVNAIILASSFIPQVQAFVTTNPEAVVTGITAINIIIRLITKSRVQLFN